jgi:hypothetical protein
MRVELAFRGCPPVSDRCGWKVLPSSGEGVKEVAWKFHNKLVARGLHPILNATLNYRQASYCWLFAQTSV